MKKLHRRASSPACRSPARRCLAIPASGRHEVDPAQGRHLHPESPLDRQEGHRRVKFVWGGKHPHNVVVASGPKKFHSQERRRRATVQGQGHEEGAPTGSSARSTPGMTLRAHSVK